MNNSCSRTIAKIFSYFKNTHLEILITRKDRTYKINPKEFETFAFQSEDQLQIVPRIKAATLPQTPDGHLHILLDQEKAIRVPSQMILIPHKGYLIPEHLCVLTGVGTSSLEPIGKKHIENYIKYMGLWPEMTFLEIGCGIGRDAFQILPILNEKGRYIGIDVTYDSIQWLQKQITPHHPHFTFHHHNAKHELYNPLGSYTSFDFTLPTGNRTVDRMAIGSVFTHLFEDEILHYMAEIKRVLKPQGLAYATFFLYCEEAVAASRAKSITPFNLRFEHFHKDGCFVNDPRYKTGAVAYTHDAILRMIQQAGLKLAKPLIRGYWSGLFPSSDDGQDVAILEIA